MHSMQNAHAQSFHVSPCAGQAFYGQPLFPQGNLFHSQPTMNMNQQPTQQSTPPPTRAQNPQGNQMPFGAAAFAAALDGGGVSSAPQGYASAFTALGKNSKAE